ncbi:hypothetical protein [Kribbella lupini]|uniref:Uncharacterized protein n=1 Tax=Kribbella lupini TaxID=291602 RepID=A0ABP4LYH5_9ACTN
MTDIISLVLNFLGPLVGVLIGGAIALRTQSSAFAGETSLRIRAEKREAYLRFVAAARSWQATVLNPEVNIRGPAVYGNRKYADAGLAYAESIRALTEVRLVGGQPAIDEAWRWDNALRTLSDAIANSEDSAGAEKAVEACQDAEAAFIAAARYDLDNAFDNSPRRR